MIHNNNKKLYNKSWNLFFLYLTDNRYFKNDTLPFILGNNKNLQNYTIITITYLIITTDRYFSVSTTKILSLSRPSNTKLDFNILTRIPVLSKIKQNYETKIHQCSEIIVEFIFSIPTY